ncbi:T9SS type A sorting domain-containing protein [Lunatimonas salinarum]|uniref:T9SS type A sorting domain-containing protein n=1 Tax=Lunatimonas salinarum TaxID=1774590 RepID=UPI001AE0219F|nr:T9SS type A sorting domain-containing protein [Lunatimonas salinarum]
MAVGAVGDWGDPLTWEVFQEGTWSPALVPPSRVNDVFILRGQEVRLSESAEVNSLHLFGQGESPGRKLNLQQFDLNIYGALRSIGEDLDGNWVIHPNAHPSTDWIYPEQGSLVFRGESRVVVDRSSWSGLTNYSRFMVRFNPEPGAVLTVNAAFKANAFIIESGTVYQTVNTEGTAATSTFSFNIHDSFGVGAYGSLIVRSGARLISEASAPDGQILRRTGARPAAEFIVEEDAELVLLGLRPQLEAASVQLDGRVTYLNEGVQNQQFLAKTFAESQQITTYHTLTFAGVGPKILPSELILHGDFLVEGGSVLDGGTALTLLGVEDQLIDWDGFRLTDLSVSKSGGLVRMAHDAEVMRDLSMEAGYVDFEGNRLLLNTLAVGTYRYQQGYWRNLSGLDLHHLANTLDDLNAVFPFFDDILGSPRKLRLLAHSITSNQGLSIEYLQQPGVGYGAGLIDHDGKEIVYYLHSHFVMNRTGDHEGELEVWIQGDDMVLNDLSDLRISGDGEVAHGLHRESVVQHTTLWAGRLLEFEDLSAATFTLASTEPLSILPLEWAHLSATEVDGGVQITWQSEAKEGTRFKLVRALGAGVPFDPVMDAASDSLGREGASFYFLDSLQGFSEIRVFYQLIALYEGGTVSESPVFAVTVKDSGGETTAAIFPNPYFSGPVNLIIPPRFLRGDTRLIIHDSRGKLWQDRVLESQKQVMDLAAHLAELGQGVYFFHLLNKQNSQTIKWLKKY